jgi:hypothetical protein
MTEKQIERIRTKIKKIRYSLAAEKRKFGCFDDSRGMRYIPPGLFIKIGDFKGGLTYLKWFKKNFPDDIGFPDFLFAWTIILFENGKIKDSKRKAIETFFSNTYIFDKFFGREIIPIEKSENSTIETPEFCDYFEYSHEQKELSDFSEWLAEYEKSEEFKTLTTKFIELNKLLLNEDDREIRKQLLDQERKLIDF